MSFKNKNYKEILEYFRLLVFEVINLKEADLSDDDRKKLTGLIGLFLQQKLLQSYMAFIYLKGGGKSVKKAFVLFENELSEIGDDRVKLGKFITKNLIEGSRELALKISEKLDINEVNEIQLRLKNKIKHMKFE